MSYKTIKHSLKLFLFIALLLTVPRQVIAVTLIDDEGKSISFTQPFERIISLYPAHTENLISLGCDDQLIGISSSDTYPASISKKPRFSYRDNVEKFLASKPDLILIRPMISRSQPELIAKLRNSGITIASIQPTSIEQMFSYWKALGRLTGKEAQAASMVVQFTAAISELRFQNPIEQEKRPRVYFESIHSKMKTFAPSAITMFALDAAGGRNIATEASGRNNSNIAPYGKERLLSKAGQIDVFLSQVGRMNRVTVDDIYNEPGFQLIKAVRTRSVFLIEEELVSRPTMRLLTGIGKIQSILYPDLKEDQQELAIYESLDNPQLRRQ